MRTAPSSLAARLFLLSFNLDKNRLARFTELGCLVRAGALTDLFLAGRLVDDNGRAKVDARRRDPVPDPVLAEVLRQVADSRPRKWKYWVDKRSRATNLAVRDQLAADGWIRVERRRLLRVIPADRVTVRERAAVAQLQREAGRVLRGSVPMSRVDARDAALVALAATGELRTLAGRRERRENKRRIAEAAVATGPVAPALRAAIKDKQAHAGAAGCRAAILRRPRPSPTMPRTSPGDRCRATRASGLLRTAIASAGTSPWRK